MRAEAADRVADKHPAAAHDAVTAIAAAARTSLTETRRVLAGLRESGDFDLAPPPDLDAIRRMVAELADADIDVGIITDRCDEHPPSAVVASGAYRIVQESLTNAVRHAGPNAKIGVTLTCRNGELDITVADDGTGRSADDHDGAGSGLTGMAERATVLGGTFEAGNDPTGGFVVNAVLPTDRRPTAPNSNP